MNNDKYTYWEETLNWYLTTQILWEEHCMPTVTVHVSVMDGSIVAVGLILSEVSSFDSKSWFSKILNQKLARKIKNNATDMWLENATLESQSGFTGNSLNTQSNPLYRKVYYYYCIYSQKTDSTAVLDPTTLYTATPTLYGSPSVTGRVWPEQNGCGFSFIGSAEVTHSLIPHTQ